MQKIYDYSQENVFLMPDYRNSLVKKKSLQFPAFDPSYHVTQAPNLFEGLSDAKHIDVSQMNWSEIKSIAGMFLWDTKLEEIDLSQIHMDEVVAISCMFERCRSLKIIDLSNQSFEKVVYANAMFLQCSVLECLDISSCENTIVLKSVLEYSLPHLKRVFVKDKKVKNFLFGMNPNIGFDIVAVN